MATPKKIKTQEQVAFEALEAQIKNDAMRDFGFAFKDHKGESFFVPDEGTGYVMNFKCQIDRAKFEEKFRAYWDKTH